MKLPILAADFTSGSKHRSATLTINRIVDGRREHISAYECSGKRAARKMALLLGATPWNF